MVIPKIGEKIVTYQEKILTALSHVPIATVEQLGRLALRTTQPEKKISIYLNQLRKEKLIQSKCLERKLLWSLTPKEKKRRGITFPRNRIHHDLAIGTIYFDRIPYLDEEGKPYLTYFKFEPRYEYKVRSEKLIYAPDCEFEYRGKLCIAEVQISSYSQKQWSGKWENGANKFFAKDEWKKHFDRKPFILAITNSSKEIASQGFNVPERRLNVFKDISDLGS